MAKKADPIIGRKVKEIRRLTNKEKSQFGWYQDGPVIVLIGGTILFPSRDSEGNGPGVLFGKDKDNNEFVLY